MSLQIGKVMKRINVFVSLPALALGFASCAELDVLPIDSAAKVAFYSTETEVTGATDAVYSSLTLQQGAHPLYGDMLVYLVDLGSDHARVGDNMNNQNIRALSNLTTDPNNDRVDIAWEELYVGVNRANNVIDRVPGATAVNEELRTRLVHEARFLRALFYFNAVRLWGEVPVVAHDGEGYGAGRQPVDSVYRFIVADLRAAADVLPDARVFAGGRATRWAASALLAKVYLTWGQTSETLSEGERRDLFDLAAQEAEKVVESGHFVLAETFLDIWNTTKRDGDEHIFTAHFSAGQNPYDGTAGNIIAHCTFATGFSNAEAAIEVTDHYYYDIFDPADRRRSGSFAKTLYDPSKGEHFVYTLPRFRKYIDTVGVQPSPNKRDIDVPIVRYAEVLLTLAEAINERDHAPNAQAYAAINAIRDRAFGDTEHRYAGLDYAAFREAVQDENYFEFVLEQHRWFDLVRWKVLIEKLKAVPLKRSRVEDLERLGANAEQRLFRFPIPQSQRNSNPEGLWQNWGYDGADGTAVPYPASYR
jgi:hypothetical protein